MARARTRARTRALRHPATLRFLGLPCERAPARDPLPPPLTRRLRPGGSQPTWPDPECQGRGCSSAAGWEPRRGLCEVAGIPPLRWCLPAGLLVMTPATPLRAGVQGLTVCQALSSALSTIISFNLRYPENYIVLIPILRERKMTRSVVRPRSHS